MGGQVDVLTREPLGNALSERAALGGCQRKPLQILAIERATAVALGREISCELVGRRTRNRSLTSPSPPHTGTPLGLDGSFGRSPKPVKVRNLRSRRKLERGSQSQPATHCQVRLKAGTDLRADLLARFSIPLGGQTNIARTLQDRAVRRRDDQLSRDASAAADAISLRKSPCRSELTHISQIPT